jgi:pimeloyl-ACP methyl ester carboxylesterase
MVKKLGFLVAGLIALWLLASVLAGCFLLPPMLLQGPVPSRTEAQRQEIRENLCGPVDRWSVESVAGGEGVPLEVWRLHRPASRGIAIVLHGFGDDAWGSASRARDLPAWDTAVFTFRGRDRHPEVPGTLGGWERSDVVAVVHHFEAQGIPRDRILLVAASQGAGVALLALSDLERAGGPLAGALLECPYQDLACAARDHLQGTLGRSERLVRPAEWIALWRVGRMARFDPVVVSPEKAARGLRTPVALITGDADAITPLEGVRAIARSCPDLTVVPGAGHCEAGGRVPGGWRAWAETRLLRWRL